jgi:hypothetical protein
MAPQARATFQKREKERARQQKQHDKVQRRLAAKAQRTSSAPRLEDDELALAGTRPGPHALPPPWDEAPPPD